MSFSPFWGRFDNLSKAHGFDEKFNRKNKGQEPVPSYRGLKEISQKSVISQSDEE